MLVIGLTGSIAMGKSAAARLLRRARLPVHDSDAAGHVLMGRGGAAVAPLEAAFPGCVRDGVVDRAILRQRISGDAAARTRRVPMAAVTHQPRWRNVSLNRPTRSAATAATAARKSHASHAPSGDTAGADARQVLGIGRAVRAGVPGVHAKRRA
jgi:hypothetical protein